MPITQSISISPKALVPNRFSATQYQALIDCPYLFFCKYILKIKKTEIEEDFSASDFGILVHKCLHAFHFEAEGLARNIEISETNRTTLLDLLNTISHQVFASSPFSHSLVNGWLQRWLVNIPSYIDWLIDTSNNWTVLKGEVSLEATVQDKFTLFGQIDRLDINRKSQHYAVIDFKTGTSLPSKKSIMLGEAVQLPFYSLLTPQVEEVKYLDLGSQAKVSEVACIKGDELADTQRKHNERLIALYEQLCSQAELPANGDDSICSYCDYQGICRKSHWIDTENE
jgi:ATP-dependent helicase/nuclease subunit B